MRREKNGSRNTDRCFFICASSPMSVVRRCQAIICKQNNFSIFLHYACKNLHKQHLIKSQKNVSIFSEEMATVSWDRVSQKLCDKKGGRMIKRPPFFLFPRSVNFLISVARSSYFGKRGALSPIYGEISTVLVLEDAQK